MGKRKHRPVLHQQEQCDVWLSTAEKKEQTPAAKRQKLFRPITNIPDLIISSQPIKAGTKQTDIKNFFASKSATAKENVVPLECVSRKPHTAALSGNKRSATEVLGYQRPDTTASFRSFQKDEAKYRSAIALTNPQNCSLLVSEPHSVFPVSRFDENQSPLLHGERESDIFSSSQDLNGKDLCQDSKGIPQISSMHEESEDVTFTMGTQGCLKVKRPKANQHWDQNSFVRQGCLKGFDSEVAVNPYLPLESSSQTDAPSDLVYSRRDANRLENAIVIQDSKSSDVFPNDIPISVQFDSSGNEESEDITFTVGTQGCLKVKQSTTDGNVNSDTSNKRKCFNAFTVGSELFAKQGDIPDSANSQSIQASATKVIPFNCDSSEREDSEDITFTVGTQGCLKVKQARNQSVNYNVQDKFEIDAVDSELSATQDDTDESQPLLSGKSSQDVASTMGCQGCLKVKDNKGHRSLGTPSEDSSQDVAFTMGSQGCLKVRESRRYRSVDTQSEDSSQDVAFTMGSQECLKVRDHKDQESSITPSEDSSRDVDHRGQKSNITLAEDSSQDVAFTMGSQGCLKVRDHKDQESSITPSEDSSQDVDHRGQRSNVTLAEDSSLNKAFTMGSQGRVKVRDHKGQRSSITPSEDSSQDVAFTMGSLGCLELRSYISNITLPEESSQDAPFTMGSQGCMKVRDINGDEPNFTPSQNSKHSSQDVAFTMSSQGCLKVRNDRGQRSNITLSDDSSQDVDFTVGSQGCLKVRDDRGQRSNITLPEESSQDVVFTVGSQGCLKVREDRGQRSNVTLSEDSSRDVDFTVGSQGFLKVRDDKVQRSSKRQHSNLSEGETCLASLSLCREDMRVDLDGDDDDDYDEDDEFSQTQDW